MESSFILEKNSFDGVLKDLSDFLTSIPKFLIVDTSRQDLCNKAEACGKEAVYCMDNVAPAQQMIIVNGLVDLSIRDRIQFDDLYSLFTKEAPSPNQEKIKSYVNYSHSLPSQERRAYFRGYVTSLLGRYKTAYWSIENYFEKIEQKDDYEKLLVCHSILHRIIEELEDLSRKKIRNEEDIFYLYNNILQVTLASFRIVAYNQKKVSIDNLYDTLAKMTIHEPVVQIIFKDISRDH